VAPKLLPSGRMIRNSFLRTAALSGRAGLALCAASLVAALAVANGFLDLRSLVITIGGALGVTWATFPAKRLRTAWAHLVETLKRSTEHESEEAEEVIATLKRLGKIYRVEGAPALERAADATTEGFLRKAIERVLEVTTQDELRETLHGDARAALVEGEAARSVFLTLGKLFPAFGLIGTLIGLALMLRNLAGQDLSSIGPGLGISIMTTLYGAVMANAVVLPLATKLQAHLARRRLLMQMVIDGAEMIFRRELPTRIERTLRAYHGLPTREDVHAVTLLTERAA
jgi:chemotaxis protein MotA